MSHIRPFSTVKFSGVSDIKSEMRRPVYDMKRNRSSIAMCREGVLGRDM